MQVDTLPRFAMLGMLFALVTACGGGAGTEAPVGVSPVPSPSPAPAPAPSPGPGATITGLNFPSNGDAPSNAFVAFQFLNPHQRGLPMWGPNGQGVTYIWRVMPRQQPGYYVTFWWSNNGNFLWNGGSSDSYYGAHPYPKGGGAGTTAHNWEIGGMDYGADWQNTLAGGQKTVVKGQWYTQALRISPSGGTHVARFYTSLPSTAAGDVLQATRPSYFGVTNPPAPALTWGDSPWYADFQHERLSGVLRGIKIFATGLSEADMQAEAASDSVVTAAGQASIWYMNINPMPNDISDKSGRGNHPVWADPANKATLWSE